MGAAHPQKPERRHESVPGTLGAVLYANDSIPSEAEAAWVRLVGSIATGDQLALHALYERSHRLVFTLIVRITRSRETAEELTVDVFHDVWRRAGRYDPADGTVLGWIMNQARSRAIDRLRFEQRKKRVDAGPGDPPPAHEAPSSEETLELKQQRRLVQSAVASLAPGERAAIEAAFFSELTHAEVAARLNEPLGTVKTRIRAGLQKLRQALGGASS